MTATLTGSIADPATFDAFLASWKDNLKHDVPLARAADLAFADVERVTVPIIDFEDIHERSVRALMRAPIQAQHGTGNRTMFKSKNVNGNDYILETIQAMGAKPGGIAAIDDSDDAPEEAHGSAFEPNYLADKHGDDDPREADRSCRGQYLGVRPIDVTLAAQDDSATDSLLEEAFKLTLASDDGIAALAKAEAEYRVTDLTNLKAVVLSYLLEQNAEWAAQFKAGHICQAVLDKDDAGNETRCGEPVPKQPGAGRPFKYCRKHDRLMHDKHYHERQAE